MKTIGQALDESRGIGPGFDFMRVALAFSVVAWHSIPITTGSVEVINTAWYWILVYSIVPVFFALSGFLVTGSALRLDVGPFVASRALRIVPALFVDTAVSILIFGSILTTLDWSDYILHPETMKYWLNVVGEIHFRLPGVFESNPDNSVNGSLWTIKPELGCYLIMTLLIASGLVKRWPVTLAILVGLWLASWASQQVPFDFTGKHQLATDVSKLVIFFLAGSLAYLLRYKIPYSPWIAGASIAFIAACAILAEGQWLMDSRPFMIISIPALTYLTIWLGLQKIPPLPLFKTGDYSYGIYLYAYPIQQIVVQATGTREPAITFLLTIVPVTLVAIASWHLVEKPTLKLRKYLKATPNKPIAGGKEQGTAKPRTAIETSRGGE